MVVERLPEPLDEHADPVEPHALALLVEVKVLVVGPLLAEGLHRVLERLLDGLLVPLLVDEVDEVEVAVEVELVRDVRLDGFGLT